MTAVAARDAITRTGIRRVYVLRVVCTVLPSLAERLRLAPVRPPMAVGVQVATRDAIRRMRERHEPPRM